MQRRIIDNYHHAFFVTFSCYHCKKLLHIDKVKGIHDEISVEDPTSFNTRSNDTWITTKCKSTLLGAKGLDATHVKVVTEDGVVYLMGLVTREEGNTAAKTVQQVTGVQKVVKVFEYID